MANPSTIWAQLAMPDPPAGSVPYVLSDGVTIGTDVLNFSYDSILKALNITGGVEFPYFSNVGSPTPVNTNNIMGTVTLALGTTTMVVNNPYIRAGAKIFIQRRSNDATATQLSVTTIAVGTFTIAANANATAGVNIDFWIVNTNPATA